jgi:hypothetical protein
MASCPKANLLLPPAHTVANVTGTQLRYTVKVSADRCSSLSRAAASAWGVLVRAWTCIQALSIGRN